MTCRRGRPLTAVVAAVIWGSAALAAQTPAPGTAVSKTVTADRDWRAQSATVLGTSEAAAVVRLGDVDNLGFGWPAGFDPFCGRMTDAHPFPWKVSAGEVAGLDRMLVSSAFDPTRTERECHADGYSRSDDPAPVRPVPYRLALDAVKGLVVEQAYLQLFIDDFQAPALCSRFQVTLNGTRFLEAERILNAIEQTGPVGKLVTVKVPEEFHPVIARGETLELRLDETTGAADGFALDFIRLLVNRNRESACRGDQSGTVIDRATLTPIAGAVVASADATPVTTGADGRFVLRGLPTGVGAVTATASGYNAASKGVEVFEPGDETPEVVVELERGAGTAAFAGQQLSAGDTTTTLGNLLFDQGKAELRPASLAELDRIAAFLRANPTAEIELSGHTSSEGDAALNRSLSYARVKACKDYVVGTGIDAGRITVQGHGPDRPVGSNDTEGGRARNRRVEMRVLRL